MPRASAEARKVTSAATSSGTRRHLQALRVDDRGLPFGRVPFLLARRLDVARNDAGDADIVGAEVARERPRQAFDRRLAGLVEHQPGQPEVPADRAQIDDRAAAVRAHPRHHRLGAEELVLEVHVEPVVPIFLGDLIDVVAVVVGGIVDQHVERPAPLDQPLDAAASLRDVREIDLLERARRSARQARRDSSSFSMSMKVTSEPWRANAFDDARANARSAAGDEHSLAAQARIERAQVPRVRQTLNPQCRRSSSACRIRPRRSPARARRSSICGCRRTARDNRRPRSAG